MQTLHNCQRVLVLENWRFIFVNIFYSKLQNEPESILDFGCGGGWFTLTLALKYPKAKITGIDCSKDAIDFAQSRLKESKLTNVKFQLSQFVDLREADNSYDVVTCSLVCHHIPTQEEIIAFLKKAARVARKAVIINDLERDTGAILAFRWLLCPALFTNRLTRNDGELSVRRAFTHNEWRDYLERAGLEKFEIFSRPFSRFIIFVDTTKGKRD